MTLTLISCTSDPTPIRLTEPPVKRSSANIDSRLPPAETLADSITDFFNSIPLRFPAVTDAEHRLMNWKNSK